MRRKLTFALLIVALAVCRLASAQDHPPSYKVDADWPKQLPNNWIMGQVSGIAVDRQDHVWVLQRPAPTQKTIWPRRSHRRSPSAALRRRRSWNLIARAI